MNIWWECVRVCLCVCVCACVIVPFVLFRISVLWVVFSCVCVVSFVCYFVCFVVLRVSSVLLICAWVVSSVVSSVCYFVCCFVCVLFRVCGVCVCVSMNSAYIFILTTSRKHFQFGSINMTCTLFRISISNLKRLEVTRSRSQNVGNTIVVHNCVSYTPRRWYFLDNITWKPKSEQWKNICNWAVENQHC